MKYMRQLALILAVTCAAELIKVAVPLPVPAGIYGLLLLFGLLLSGVIKLSQLEETADFLLLIMPLMFIPAGVGLLSGWSLAAPVIVPLLAITLVSTVIVFGVTGRLAQRMSRRSYEERMVSELQDELMQAIALEELQENEDAYAQETDRDRGASAGLQSECAGRSATAAFRDEREGKR